MEALFGIPAGVPYEQRCAGLIEQHVAVWDVLRTCTRSSSLDSDIERASMIPNDFVAFFAAHRFIRAIYFNGAMAEQSFSRYVLPELPAAVTALPRIRLPSTSPANASFSFQRKLDEWRRLRMPEQ